MWRPVRNVNDSCEGTMATAGKLLVQIHDEQGRELDARIDLFLQDDLAAIRFHSRSGAEDDPNRRNHDYIPAYDLVLRRLAADQALLVRAYLDSRPAQVKRPDPEGRRF